MNKILVAKGSVLKSHLCDRLLKKGYEVFSFFNLFINS